MTIERRQSLPTSDDETRQPMHEPETPSRIDAEALILAERRLEEIKPLVAPVVENPATNFTLLSPTVVDETQLSKVACLTWRSSHNLLLMVLPNLFNPYKLFDNIRHPFYEFIHSRHRQYPLTNNPRVHVVEHEFLGKLLTVDIVEENQFATGFIPRIRQLFDRKFYYGHCEYFPKPFRLINRTYVRNSTFNIEGHVNQVLDNRK